MADIIKTPDDNSWQNPEKVVGYAFLAGIIGTGIYFWGLILPFLLDMVYDTVKLGIGCGILFLLFIAVTKGQTLLWYVGQRIFRNIAGIFVSTDPIGIMQDYIKDTESEAHKMQKDINEIEGGSQLIKRKLSENAKNMKDKLDLAHSAQRQGDMEQAEVFASQAAQYEEYNARLQPMAETSNNVLIVLQQIYKAALRQIDKSKFEVNILADEFELIKRTSNAMKSAMNILRGDKDKKYFFDLASNAAANQMASKLGQIRQAMKYSQSYVKEMDISNGVMSDKGMQLLEKYKKGEFQDLLGTEANPVKLTAAGQAQRGNDAYSALLD